MRNWGHFIRSAFLLVSFFSLAQVTPKPEIDSLLKKAHSFYKTNQDSALFYAEKAYRKSLAINDVKLIARSIIYKNTYLITQKKYDEAERLFQYNLTHLDSLPEVSKGDTYYNLAAIKDLKEEYDLALENYFKSIIHYEKGNIEKGLQKSFLQIGVIYSKLNRKDLANYFYDKSLAAGANNHSAEGNGILPTTHDEHEKLAMSEKLLSGIENKSNSRLASIIYYNMGKSYVELEDYNNVINYNLKSLEIKNRIGYLMNQDRSNAYIGEAFYNLKNYSQAIVYLNKALENSSKREFQLNINRLLYQAYEKAGDYKNALRVSTSLNRIQDSLNLAEERERIAKITAQFETEKQAQEIEILETDNSLKASQLANQRTIIWASAIGVVLLLLSLLLAYKNHKTKQNLQFSELTQKLLQMQLNPHFLFNALNGIQYFIKNNDVKKSTKYISNFSGLMRNILENSVEKFISIQEDFDTIKDFLELQQLVNNNSFDYDINISDNIDMENMCIPPMFTQPFVENAIIHGVANMTQGKINVNYKLDNQFIIVEIIDNGKGIDPNTQNANSLHKSMGTSITKQRMDNLLKMEQYPIELVVVSENQNNEAQGTKVVLSFPVKYL